MTRRLRLIHRWCREGLGPPEDVQNLAPEEPVEEGEQNVQMETIEWKNPCVHCYEQWPSAVAPKRCAGTEKKCILYKILYLNIISILGLAPDEPVQAGEQNLLDLYVSLFGFCCVVNS